MTRTGGPFANTTVSACAVFEDTHLIWSLLRFQVNGFPRDVPTFRRVRGHVTHTDVHPVYATVRECVMFSAKLRLPRETTPSMRDALVNEVGLALQLKKRSSNDFF